jgi:hypothetical protein
MQRWERRDQKRESRRKQMQMHGAALRTPVRDHTKEMAGKLVKRSR